MKRDRRPYGQSTLCRGLQKFKSRVFVKTRPLYGPCPIGCFRPTSGRVPAHTGEQCPVDPSPRPGSPRKRSGYEWARRLDVGVSRRRAQTGESCASAAHRSQRGPSVWSLTASPKSAITAPRRGAPEAIACKSAQKSGASGAATRRSYCTFRRSC